MRAASTFLLAPSNAALSISISIFSFIPFFFLRLVHAALPPSVLDGEIGSRLRLSRTRLIPPYPRGPALGFRVACLAALTADRC